MHGSPPRSAGGAPLEGEAARGKSHQPPLEKKLFAVTLTLELLYPGRVTGLLCAGLMDRRLVQVVLVVRVDKGFSLNG